VSGYRAIAAALEALAGWLDDGTGAGLPTKWLVAQAVIAIREIAGTPGPRPSSPTYCPARTRVTSHEGRAGHRHHPVAGGHCVVDAGADDRPGRLSAGRCLMGPRAQVATVIAVAAGGAALVVIALAVVLLALNALNALPGDAVHSYLNYFSSVGQQFQQAQQAHRGHP
jgi:hypothetical protein